MIRFDHEADSMVESAEGDYVCYYDVKNLQAERDAALKRVEELEEVIPPLLENAVILSDEYLSAFADYGPDDAIQGWEKSRWLRASAAKKNVEKALTSARVAERTCPLNNDAPNTCPCEGIACLDNRRT
jgi:hypothetical protein